MLFNNMDVKFVKAFTIVIIFFFYQACFANGFESTENLKKIATNFVLNNVTVNPDESIDVQINKSDLAKQLTVCSQEIEASLPKDSSKEKISAVELTCNGTRPWHIFIPVDVQVLVNVIVAKQIISPRDLITEDDLDYSKMNKNHLYAGFFKNKEEVLGLEASQLIVAGSVLTKKNIQEPILIRRDATVLLSAKKNSMIVSVKGIAKTDGRLHDSIQIMNPSSKRIINAIVVGPNQAEVV